MPIAPKKRKNVRLKGKFSQIFHSRARELAPFGMVFVYEPENFEQQKLGALFGLIKISDYSDDSSYVANLLASVLKKEYFSKSDRPADVAFEASLKKANLALGELARQGLVKWSGKLSLAAGALEKNNFHFSKLGTTAVLLLRGGMIADIGSGMGADTEAAESHPLKTFSDISSGRLEYGDCLILSTNDLLEIFSLEELRQNAAFFPRNEFPEILSASLQTNSELSGAIVVNMLSEEEILSTIAEDVRNIEIPPLHMPDKYIPADSTKDIEAPFQPSPSLDIPAKPKNEKHVYVSEGEDVIARKSISDKISATVRKIVIGRNFVFVFIQRKIISPLGKIEYSQKFSRFWQKIRLARPQPSLPLISFSWMRENAKIWLSAIVLVLIVVAFFVFRSKKAPAPPVSAPTQSVSPAASLSDIQVKNIGSLDQVASLPQNGFSLVLLNETLYGFSGDKSVSKIDPNSGQVETTDANINSGKFLLAADMTDLNTIFILAADKKIISFTPVNKNFQENNIALPENLNVSDLKTYLTYLYVLDPAANQIYRFPRADGGFGEAQNWLKTGADIKNAVSFAINGDLFVATNDQITAFLQGKKDEKINFEDPNTTLVINKIYTAPDLENIYVLDNKNHRIVEYSKDGKIASQYVNDQISEIKDFTVDEKNKAVYLLKEKDISKFSIE